MLIYNEMSEGIVKSDTNQMVVLQLLCSLVRGKTKGAPACVYSAKEINLHFNASIVHSVAINRLMFHTAKLECV